MSDSQVEAFQDCQCALCVQYADAVARGNVDAASAVMDEIIEHCPAYQALTRDRHEVPK